MTPELKARWIAALESGEYRHGKHMLKRRDPDVGPVHCCIGVLAEIAAEDLMSLGYHVERSDRRINVLSEDAIEAQETAIGGAFELYKDDISTLVRINDSDFTTDYTRQIEYIKENL